jgi:hypothetical protein
MPFFDLFRKHKPESEPQKSLPQLCYEIAYFILPHYAHRDLAGLQEICERPNIANAFFYIMACNRHKIEPEESALSLFRWHLGELPNGCAHLTLEYPIPPPVNMASLSLRQMKQMVLAPYFSCVLQSSEGAATYYILGQSPLGGTTLRMVTADGSNCNLGPGPEPTLESFLAQVQATEK